MEITIVSSSNEHYEIDTSSLTLSQESVSAIWNAHHIDYTAGHSFAEVRDGLITVELRLSNQLSQCESGSTEAASVRNALTHLNELKRRTAQLLKLQTILQSEKPNAAVTMQNRMGQDLFPRIFSTAYFLLSILREPPPANQVEALILDLIDTPPKSLPSWTLLHAIDEDGGTIPFTRINPILSRILCSDPVHLEAAADLARLLEVDDPAMLEDLLKIVRQIDDENVLRCVSCHLHSLFNRWSPLQRGLCPRLLGDIAAIENTKDAVHALRLTAELCADKQQTPGDIYDFLTFTLHTDPRILAPFQVSDFPTEKLSTVAEFLSLIKKGPLNVVLPLISKAQQARATAGGSIFALPEIFDILALLNAGEQERLVTWFEEGNEPTWKSGVMQLPTLTDGERSAYYALSSYRLQFIGFLSDRGVTIPDAIRRTEVLKGVEESDQAPLVKIILQSSESHPNSILDIFDVWMSVPPEHRIPLWSDLTQLNRSASTVDDLLSLIRILGPLEDDERRNYLRDISTLQSGLLTDFNIIGLLRELAGLSSDVREATTRWVAATFALPCSEPKWSPYIIEAAIRKVARSIQTRGTHPPALTWLNTSAYFLWSPLSILEILDLVTSSTDEEVERVGRRLEVLFQPQSQNLRHCLTVITPLLLPLRTYSDAEWEAAAAFCHRYQPVDSGSSSLYWHNLSQLFLVLNKIDDDLRQPLLAWLLGEEVEGAPFSLKETLRVLRKVTESELSSAKMLDIQKRQVELLEPLLGKIAQLDLILLLSSLSPDEEEAIVTILSRAATIWKGDHSTRLLASLGEFLQGLRTTLSLQIGERLLTDLNACSSSADASLIAAVLERASGLEPEQKVARALALLRFSISDSDELLPQLIGKLIAFESDPNKFTTLQSAYSDFVVVVSAQDELHKLSGLLRIPPERRTLFLQNYGYITPLYNPNTEPGVSTFSLDRSQIPDHVIGYLDAVQYHLMPFGRPLDWNNVQLRLDGVEGVAQDATGVRRAVISDLIAAWVATERDSDSALLIDGDEGSHDLQLPHSSWEAESTLETIGALMAASYHASKSNSGFGQFPIGSHFADQLYDRLRIYLQCPHHAPFEQLAHIAQIHLLMTGCSKNLQQRCFASLNGDPRTLFSSEQTEEETRAVLLSLGLWGDELERFLTKESREEHHDELIALINEGVSDCLRNPRFLASIRAIRSLATGFAFGHEVIVVDPSLATAIQGELSAEGIIEKLTPQHYSGEDAERIIEILSEWLRANRENLDFLKDFIQFVTGARSLTGSILITPLNKSPSHLPQASTCFRQLKLPNYPLEGEEAAAHIISKLEEAIVGAGAAFSYA